MKLLAKIAAFAAVGLVTLSAQAASKTDECFNYFKAQDYVRAVQAGREATRATPQQGDAHYCLGLSFKSLGDADNAMRSLQQAEKLFSKKSDLAAVYAQLGMVAGLKGDLQQALNYYSRQLGLQRETGNRSGESAALNNIASVFSDRGELDKALDYYQQSLNIEPVEANKATNYNNIGLLYANKGDYPHAIEYLDKAIALDRRNGNYHGAAIHILNKGYVQTLQGAYDVAEATLKEGLSAIRKVKDQYWESVAYGYLGDLARQRSQFDQARSHYQEGLRLARQAGATAQVERFGRSLAGLQKTATAVSFGVVEIGSKGVKAAVVTSSRDEKGRTQVETGFRKSINTNIIQGVAETGEFAPAAIEETAQAVSELVTAIKANSPNLGDNISIAGSSAMAGAINRSDLAARVQALTGIQPRFINSAEELSYAIYGSIRDDLAHKTALLDIGSGNGRLGYLISPRGDRPAGQAVIDLRAGSVTLAELANKGRNPGEDYLTALNRVVEKEIAPRVGNDLKQYPVIRKHRYFLLVGGAAWAMTTMLHPEEQGTYVRLSSQDMKDYFQRLASNPDAVLNPDLGKIADPRIREKAAKQVETVKKVFNLENLLAGASLLKLVAENDPFGNAEIYFAREGNWAYGLAEAQAMSKTAAK